MHGFIRTALSPTEMIAELLRIDPERAKVLIAGLAVMAAVSIAASFGINPELLLTTGIALTAGYLLLTFLSRIPNWCSKFCGVTICVALMGYLGLFAVQLVSGGRVPGVMPPGCFFSWWSESCPMYDGAGEEPELLPPDASAEAQTGPGGGAILLAASWSAGPRALVPGLHRPGAATEPILAALHGDQRVEIRYSPGNVSEATPASLARDLVSEGWKAARPEPLNAAFGLREVRYSARADEAAARALAQAARDVIGGKIDVRYDPDGRKGWLAIWLGR